MARWICLALTLFCGTALGQGTLTPPELFLPENGGLNYTSASFEWNASAGATAYQLQISPDSTLFQDLVVDTTTAQTYFYDEIFEPDDWYHWRVRAFNEADTSAWSEVWRFFLMFPVSVEPGAEGAQQVRLGPNYPNPCRVATRLEYQLHQAAEVRLEVLNLLGQRLVTLVEEWKPSGLHTVEWNASGVSSGMYVARLQAGSAVEVQMLVVVR